MVSVTILRDEEGGVAGFEATGHAGFAERGGDIVCAGVSALTQTAVLGLARRLGAPLEVVQRPGLLRCRVGGDASREVRKRAQDILETMVLGLREIAARYPERLRLAEAVPPSDEGPSGDTRQTRGGGRKREKKTEKDKGVIQHGRLEGV